MNQNFYDKLNNVIAKDSILIDEPMSVTLHFVWADRQISS